jgi:hypothetical protein
MRQTKALKKSGGGHLLQSNCEDVAVTMRNVATNVGMTCIDAVRPVTSLDDFATTLSVPRMDPTPSAESVRLDRMVFCFIITSSLYTGDRSGL